MRTSWRIFGVGCRLASRASMQNCPTGPSSCFIPCRGGRYTTPVAEDIQHQAAAQRKLKDWLSKGV
eukprot:scaffold13673_cov89-Skeletonema_dohrnii-CCMP3373.AAC.1